MKYKGKGKVHPIARHEGPRGGVEILYLFFLSGVGGQRHANAALPPGNGQVPIL
jgi:hypothetical protein